MNSQKVLQDITAFIPSWKALMPEDITLKRMTGITNKILKVSHEKADVIPQCVIYRVFGSDEENPYLKRELESRIFEEIGKAGLGPRIYGYTPEYRLEEFIPSSNLPAKRMLDEDILLKVAFKLRHFHSIDAAFIEKHSVFRVMCQSKTPFEKSHKKMGRLELFSEYELQHIGHLRTWLHEGETKWLAEHLTTLDDQLVFSHNDLLANNILVHNSDGQISFIDYEYAAYNFRAYDIANYFNESLFDYDVEEPPYYTVNPDMPNMERIRRFVQYYVLAAVVPEKELFGLLGKQAEIREMLGKYKLEGEFERVMRDIPLCLMLSDLYWGSWAVSVSKNPHINFDYISFARVRLTQYEQVKKAYFSAK